MADAMHDTIEAELFDQASAELERHTYLFRDPDHSERAFLVEVYVCGRVTLAEEHGIYERRWGAPITGEVLR